MNLAALILVTLLGGISIYDFYDLKKSKVRTLTCLSSAGITLVVNAVLFIIGLLIGSAIFGEDNDIYLIVSVILVAGVSFFRFIGRDLNKLKKDDIKKVKKDKKVNTKNKLADDIRGTGKMGGVLLVLTVLLIFWIKKDNSAEYYLLFIDPLIIGALAYWTYKKLSFWSCLAMTTIFILGKLIYFLPTYVSGATGFGGIGVAGIISFYLIKGTISAYKYNYNKY